MTDQRPEVVADELERRLEEQRAAMLRLSQQPDRIVSSAAGALAMSVICAATDKVAADCIAALRAEPADRGAEPPERAAELRMLQAYPQLAAFFDKYALGSKVAPSCFGCGHVRPRSTQHAELPDIYLCVECARGEPHYRTAAPVSGSVAFDVEAMIVACLPGGYSCDPQQVADAIREYCAALSGPKTVSGSVAELLREAVIGALERAKQVVVNGEPCVLLSSADDTRIRAALSGPVAPPPSKDSGESKKNQKNSGPDRQHVYDGSPCWCGEYSSQDTVPLTTKE